MARRQRDAVKRVEMTAPLGSGAPLRVPESQVEAYTARGFGLVKPPRKASAKPDAKSDE